MKSTHLSIILILTVSVIAGTGTVFAQNGTGLLTKMCCGLPFYLGPHPLEQFQSGVAAENVKCQQGLQLVIKMEDGSPACVRSDTAQKLIDRDWARQIMTNSSLIMNHGPPMEPFGPRIPLNGNITNETMQPLISPPAPLSPRLETHYFNYTASLQAKVPNWDQRFICYKYDAGYAIQMTAEISNAVKFSGTVTDPNGMVHNVTPVVLNSTLMQIRFTASPSDPDGSYSVAFNVVNGTNTSNVNFYCAGIETVEPRIPPALHIQPP